MGIGSMLWRLTCLVGRLCLCAKILAVLEVHSTTTREQLQRSPNSANPRAVPCFDGAKIGCLAAQLRLPFLLVQEAVQQRFPDLIQP